MDIFSNLQVIGECLLDKRRVDSIRVAVNEIVKPGDVVVDCGTGSGIIALLAAEAGASKVYAVEIAEDVAKFAESNIKSNGYSKKIKVINCDVRDLEVLERKVNVVTAEMLDTCLVSEQQAQAINHLHRLGLTDKNTIFIPNKLECLVQAVQYNFDFYGFKMPFVIQARNFGSLAHVEKILSKQEVFKVVNFKKIVHTSVNEIVNLVVKESGDFNAIVLGSKTYFTDKVTISATSDMNMPVVIPIKPMQVKKGSQVKIKIKYFMGEGFGKFSVRVISS